METVKDIIVNLARDVRETRAGNKRESDWQSIPVDRFLRKDDRVKLVRFSFGTAVNVLSGWLKSFDSIMRCLDRNIIFSSVVQSRKKSEAFCFCLQSTKCLYQ